MQYLIDNIAFFKGYISNSFDNRFATRLWFSRVTPVSSNNKTDDNSITEILLKVALHASSKPSN
jgi:hypothetical protein